MFCCALFCIHSSFALDSAAVEVAVVEFQFCNHLDVNKELVALLLVSS